MKITIPVLCSSSFELTKFDFSFRDISIYDLVSKEFSEYIEFQQPDFKVENMKFIDDIRSEILAINHRKKQLSFNTNRYVIVKNNPKENFNYSDIINVWKFLLIVFPSDLQIEYEINCDFKENFFHKIFMSSFNLHSAGEYCIPLYSNDDYVEEINEYAKTVFERLNLKNYIGIAIENYITSFSASQLQYQYLTLCISLESLIYGNQELTYRLRR